MDTTEISPRIARALHARRTARRLNGYALVAAAVLLGLGLFQVVGASGIWFWLFFMVLVTHLGAAARMAFRPCPKCGQPFAKRSLLGLVSSLEEQFTTECQSCGLKIDADLKGKNPQA